MTKVLNLFIKAFYLFRFNLARGNILYYLASIESLSKLPMDYTWGDRYMNWIEYLRLRSQGIKCSFSDVENEFFRYWSKKMDDAIILMEQERGKNPIDY